MTLISAICPTRDRRKFLPGAIQDFLAQDYPAKELLILDDGEVSCRDLVPKRAELRYIRRLTRLSVGSKRNRACALASGEIICHWDDDDAYGPHRISEQVATLEETGADVTGYQDLLFLRPGDRKLWLYTGSGDYVVGVSLCYRRRYWETHRFREDVEFGEDNQFVQGIPRGKLVIRNSNQIIARIHPGNTCQKSEEAQLRNQEFWREIA